MFFSLCSVGSVCLTSQRVRCVLLLCRTRPCVRALCSTPKQGERDAKTTNTTWYAEEFPRMIRGWRAALQTPVPRLGSAPPPTPPLRRPPSDAFPPTPGCRAARSQRAPS